MEGSSSIVLTRIRECERETERCASQRVRERVGCERERVVVVFEYLLVCCFVGLSGHRRLRPNLREEILHVTPISCIPKVAPSRSPRSLFPVGMSGPLRLQLHAAAIHEPCTE